MNVRMYENPTVQANLDRIRGEGGVIQEPEAGSLACGETGRGRLAPKLSALAAELGRRGWLTEYQVDQLLHHGGQGQGHFQGSRAVGKGAEGQGIRKAVQGRGAHGAASLRGLPRARNRLVTSAARAGTDWRERR